MPTQKVEVGFDLTGTGGPFLVLDDPIAGQLDNADWVLGGTLFYDITSRVRSIRTDRGKSVDIGTFSAGEVVVELNNNDRAFDPLYASSPFYGNIVPKREVRTWTNYELVPASVRTNLIPNPSFETNTTGWSGSSCTLSTDTTFYYVGTQAMRGTVTNAASVAYTDYSSRIPATAGQTYTLSAYVYTPVTNTANTTFRAEFQPFNGTSYLSGILGTTVTVTRGQWTRISVTATMPATTVSVLPRISNRSLLAVGQVFVVDGIMTEQASTLGEYFDGSNTADDEWTTYAWNGTANASTSTKTITEHELGRVFTGVIDDWNLEYSVEGEATATFVASDGFVFFNNQTLTPGTATVQNSGARISAVLDDAAVNWPTALRNIDTGVATLGADVIADNTNALTYLRLIEQSEFGRFFIGKNGYATFLDRTVAASSSGAVHLSDDGTGIGYANLKIVYGSEQLANEVVVSSAITSSTVTAVDADSQSAYGIFNLTLEGLLVNTDAQLEDLAVFLASKYSQPEYRIDSVDVHLNDLSEANQNAMLALEIGDVVKVTFTPSGIPPAIVKYAEIISIKHDISLELQTMTLGLATLDTTALVLDDETFGRLDADNGLGF